MNVSDQLPLLPAGGRFLYSAGAGPEERKGGTRSLVYHGQTDHGSMRSVTRDVGLICDGQYLNPYILPHRDD